MIKSVKQTKYLYNYDKLKNKRREQKNISSTKYCIAILNSIIYCFFIFINSYIDILNSLKYA